MIVHLGPKYLTTARHLEQRDTLSYAAAGNAEEVAAIRDCEAAIPFREIRRDRQCRAVQLVGEEVVASGERPGRSRTLRPRMRRSSGRRGASRTRIPWAHGASVTSAERQGRKEKGERRPRSDAAGLHPTIPATKALRLLSPFCLAPLYFGPLCGPKSGRRDLNPRPPEPHSGALPGCATSRPSRAVET